MNRIVYIFALSVAIALNSSHSTAQTLQSGFVDSDGEQIYYEVTGSGPTVVLCHGLGGNHAIWYQQVPTLSKSFRVVTWDQRGFGRSTNKSKKASPLTAINDLRALLNHLGIEKAHLIGQSMGGWAVMGFSLEMPHRVISLILADTIGGIYTREIEAQFDEYIQKMMGSTPPNKLPITEHPAIGDKLSLSNPAQAFLYKQIGSTGPPPPANMGLLLRQTSFDPGRIQSLRLPVLFIVGEKDPIFTQASIREASRQLYSAKVRLMPGAGHSPYFEQPKNWNNIVMAFLELH